MSRFHTDDSWQKRVRDAVLGPGFYGPFSMDGRYVYLDKGRLATILQRRFAVDTVLQRMSGDACFIEEKIVRWPRYEYKFLTLETESCTVPGRESDGWMTYGKADWLNYAMCQADGNVMCHIIDFQELKDKFWAVLPTAGWEETVTSQSNRTKCVLVPLDWIEAEIGIFKRLIHATAEGAEIVKAYNATHYRRAARPQLQPSLFEGPSA